MKDTEFKKELEELFKKLFFESWMDDEDYNNVIETVLKENNISYESLSNDIKTGISNGYDLKSQLKLIEEIFNNNNDFL